MRRLNLRLSKREIVRIKEERRKTTDKKFALRCHAILLTQKGYVLKEISDILDCGIASVKNWVTTYRTESLAGLQTKQQPGNHRKLLKQEVEELMKKLCMNPKENGIGESQFWTVRLLKQLIWKCFGVKYLSDWSYQLLFYKCGFSFQRPTTGFKKQEKGEVKKFERNIKKNFGHWARTG